MLSEGMEALGSWGSLRPGCSHLILRPAGKLKCLQPLPLSLSGLNILAKTGWDPQAVAPGPCNPWCG